MYSELSTTAAGAEALARVGLEVEAIGLFEIFLEMGLEEAWMGFRVVAESD